MLADFLAVALGARLYTIHADAVRTGGLRGDEPIALGGALGIVLTAGTIYLTVTTARVLARSHQRPVAGAAVLDSGNELRSRLWAVDIRERRCLLDRDSLSRRLTAPG